MTPQETFTTDSEWNGKKLIAILIPPWLHLEPLIHFAVFPIPSRCRFCFYLISICHHLRRHTSVSSWFHSNYISDFTSILFRFDLCFTVISFWIHVDYLRFSFRFRSYFVWISSGFDFESISISVIYPSANGIDMWGKVWRFVILIHLTPHMILLINHRGQQCMFKFCGTLDDCLWHNCWYQEGGGWQVWHQDHGADRKAS